MDAASLTLAAAVLPLIRRDADYDAADTRYMPCYDICAAAACYATYADAATSDTR